MMLKFVLALAILIPAAPPKQQTPKQQVTKRVLIPLPNKKRVYVPPETVGVGKDCPFPTVKERIRFLCPCCGLGMSTNLVYTHLPQCPHDNCVMNEIENK